MSLFVASGFFWVVTCVSWWKLQLY